MLRCCEPGSLAVMCVEITGVMTASKITHRLIQQFRPRLADDFDCHISKAECASIVYPCGLSCL